MFAVGASSAQAAPAFFATDAKGNLLEVKKVKEKKGKKGKRARAFAATSKTPLKFTPSLTSGGLVGIDERPISGELYGVGSNNVVYRINPRTGIATGVAGPATSPFETGLEGANFGVDFNPTSPGGGAIRIVSDSGYNHRVGPDSGADGAMTPDDDLNGAEGATIVHAGYTSSARSITQPTETALLVLDSAEDRIYTQNPPNDGVLTNPVDVDFDITDIGGFDIAGPADKGYVASEDGRRSVLYRLDVESGEGKDLGVVKRAGKLISLTAQHR